MQTAILLYPAITALDAVGPYDVLSRIPGNEVVFVARERGEYRTDQGSLGVMADASFDVVVCFLVVVVTSPVVVDFFVVVDDYANAYRALAATLQRRFPARRAALWVVHVSRRIFAVLVVVIILAAASAWWLLANRTAPAVTWQGYAEADFVKIGPTQPGLLRAVSVARGDEVAEGLVQIFDADFGHDYSTRGNG